jgi:anti-anti-sigma regulatory factor
MGKSGVALISSTGADLLASLIKKLRDTRVSLKDLAEV